MAIKIPLSKGQFSLIDDKDFELVSQFRWILVRGGKGFYAVTASGPKGKPISLHRLLVDPDQENEVDHASGDGLDNRRSNLRECTHKQNLRNRKKQPNTTSRFKGVSLTSGKWVAQIEQNGEQMRLGRFKSEFKAARAYDTAARVFFGSFARTNASLGLFDGAVDRVCESKRDKNRTFLAEMARIGIKPRVAS